MTPIIKHKATLKTQGGMTLVEILGALLVFMIGIASLFAIYTQSMRMGKRGEAVHTAYNLAKNHMERLRTLNYALLPSAAETSVNINSDGDGDPNGAFIRTTTVTTNYNDSSLLTQVRVQVWYILNGAQSVKPVEITSVLLNQ